MDFEEHWQEIEDNFDFEMVYSAMKLLDWTWGQREEASIPSVQRIKKRAKELCKDAYDNKKTIGTAGFEASFYDDSLLLKFVLEEWETN